MVVSCSILVTDVNSTEALKHLNRRLDQTDESESGLGEQRNIRSRQQLEYKRSGVWHARMHSKSAQSDLTSVAIRAQIQLQKERSAGRVACRIEQP